MKSNAAKTTHPHTVILKEPATEGSQGIPRCAQDDNQPCDRLTHAKNFAHELNESRLWKIKISYQKRWTSHRRTRKSIEIQLTKPWQHSTGPKTAAGKHRSSLNALHGDPALLAMSHALRAHRRFLTALNLLIRLRKHGHCGEKSFAAHCTQLGNAATHALLKALMIAGYDFSSMIAKENPA